MSGLVERQLDRVVVDLGDRTLAQLARRLVDQRAEAAGHGIALGALVGPAGEVEDHVIGVERVAVVPGDALAQMQRVFGGVVVNVPALEQVGLEGVVLGVFHQRLERLALGVGDLGPVGGARVLGVLAPHRDLQHAALLGLLRLCRRRRGQAEHAVGHRGRSAEHTCHGEEFATVHRPRLGALGHRADVIRNAIPITPVECHDELPLLAFCRLQFRIQSALSKQTGTGTLWGMCNFEGESVCANATNLAQNC